ncbi:MAG: lipoate--protein ligase family protein [Candidatus Natronoplasma sp.]
MEWRFVPMKEYHPTVALALEEILLNEVSKTKTPIIRFWHWKNKAVTIGRSQKASNEVDLELCEQSDISVIRRPSGGGTMYHAPGDEIVYSIIAPRDHFPDDINQIYRDICETLAQTLRSIDIAARFVQPNSVFIDDKKISGSAQKITKKAVLQHGTVLYSPEEEEMFSLLKKNDSPERYIGSHISPVTGVSNLVNVSFQDLYTSLKQGFLDANQHFTKDITEQELKKAEELVDKKYGKEGWNLSP